MTVGVDAHGISWAHCVDTDDNCPLWASNGECTANPGFMMASCRASCFGCQSEGCHDVSEQCKLWAGAGECAINEAYMIQSCGFSCRTCFLNASAACRRASTVAPAAVAGTIDETMEALINGPMAARVLHRDPWLLSFENFLTADEADHLVTVAGHDFQQSRFLGDEKANGTLPRTSTTSWCNVPSCMGDTGFQQIRQRISDLVRVPWQNSEHLQLLRYEVGQYYKEHHDQISPPESAWGPRLYTFFMYLSDVETGGETVFTRLNISVPPRKGSAILWPSVFPSDLHATDDRTMHEARPVVAGTKYAANFWVHLYDFQTYHSLGCDNSVYLQSEYLESVASRGKSS